MQNRRDFFRTMIGGVAAAAAVRTWPFRVYSFPTDLTISSVDLGYSVLDYSSMPIIADPSVPAGKIFLVRLAPCFANKHISELRCGEGVIVNTKEHSRTLGSPSWIRDRLASLQEREHLSVIAGPPLGQFSAVEDGRKIIGPSDEE